MRLISYFASLTPGKTVLWCYLLWYLVNVAVLFDPTPAIWLNSAGISVVIGLALRLSVSSAGQPASSAARWQTFRLFLMPFCVSSFATLIKGQQYLLVVPTDGHVLFWSVLACAGFVLTCRLLKWTMRRHAAPRTG
jgi:hypothetical protein